MGIRRSLAPWSGVISVAATYAVCVAVAVLAEHPPWKSIAGAHCGITIWRLGQTADAPRHKTPVGASTIGVAIGLISGWQNWEAAVWVPALIVGTAACAQFALARPWPMSENSN